MLAGPGNPPGDQGIFRLADRPPALCEGRIRRRVGHHDGNVRKRRAQAAGRRARRTTQTKRGGSAGPDTANRRPSCLVCGTKWTEYLLQSPCQFATSGRKAGIFEQCDCPASAQIVKTSDRFRRPWRPMALIRSYGLSAAMSRDDPKLAGRLLCDVTQSWSAVGGGVGTYLRHKRQHILDHTPHRHLLIVPGDTRRSGRGRADDHRDRRLAQGAGKPQLPAAAAVGAGASACWRSTSPT